MVVQGNFSLRLISANTMKPIEEHSSSTGKTFVSIASNVDFWVELETLVEDGRRIFYQTAVSNSATTSRHNFKRRQRLDLTEKPSVFRFERANTQSYETVAKEKVTVRVFEATENGKKHLETITLHCCVIPSVIKPRLPERVTSLGTLLAANAPFTNHAGGGCLLKKSPALSSVGGTGSVGPSLVL